MVDQGSGESIELDAADHAIFITALQLLDSAGSLTAPQQEAVEQAALHRARHWLLKMRAEGNLVPHVDVALMGFHTVLWVSDNRHQIGPETNLLYGLLSLRKAEERGAWAEEARQSLPEVVEASEQEQGNAYRTGTCAARDYFAAMGYSEEEDLPGGLEGLVAKLEPRYPGLAEITLTDQVREWLRLPLDLEWPRGDAVPDSPIHDDSSCSGAGEAEDGTEEDDIEIDG